MGLVFVECDARSGRSGGLINIAHLRPGDLRMALPLPGSGTPVPKGSPRRGPPGLHAGYGRAFRPIVGRDAGPY